MTRKPCQMCRELHRMGQSFEYNPRDFTAAEWNAILSQTGLAGERLGRPIIRALLLRRKGPVQLPGMVDSVMVEWSFLAYRCPWSPISRVLTEEPQYVLGAAGAVYVDPAEIDANGLNFSQCLADIDDLERYYLYPFTDPTLPPREVG